jgi:AcrR family transcriptional regulator
MTVVTPERKRRAYDGSGRQERARQRLEATIVEARRLFLEHGYVATTVESIGAAVGVSTATIYKTYGGKAGLVRRLCEDALAGDGPVPALDRSDAQRLATADPHEVIRGWAKLLAEVSPRFSPLLLLLATAAEVDRDAATLLAELDAERLERMAHNARHLADGGHLREDVSLGEARDVLWLHSSPELYDLLVFRREWSLARFEAFCASSMIAALL